MGNSLSLLSQTLVSINTAPQTTAAIDQQFPRITKRLPRFLLFKNLQVFPCLLLCFGNTHASTNENHHKINSSRKRPLQIGDPVCTWRRLLFSLFLSFVLRHCRHLSQNTRHSASNFALKAPVPSEDHDDAAAAEPRHTSYEFGACMCHTRHRFTNAAAIEMVPSRRLTAGTSSISNSWMALLRITSSPSSPSYLSVLLAIHLSTRRDNVQQHVNAWATVTLGILQRITA